LEVYHLVLVSDGELMTAALGMKNSTMQRRNVHWTCRVAS
jgi:hypothetical protein